MARTATVNYTATRPTKAAAGNIDVMTVNGQNQFSDEDTNFDGIFPNMDTAIPPVGPGTAASPQKVFLFVSDGVADENLNGKRVISPTYLPLPTNTFYNQNVKLFVNNIGPAMQSCASPGLYFEVSPTQGISDAMTALFQMAATSARLTK
jgi:hypothetical protein